MKKHLRWLVLFAAVLAAQPQSPDDIRRANISGPGGTSGRCTIEVRVDTVVEVDIYGDSGRLRTLAGQPATWNRLECTAPLPSRMSEFRFRGIDGRGNVRLVQDPRSNNGVAVVRIEDPKGGSDAYKFEIEWSGGAGGGRGSFEPNRRAIPTLSAERALDLCRAEVHARGERDFGLRNIDITSVGVDTRPGRRDGIVGTFLDGGFNSLRSVEYRFSCVMEYNSGQVRTVEIMRADGR